MNCSFMYTAGVGNTEWYDTNERHTQMQIKAEEGEGMGKWENKK